MPQPKLSKLVRLVHLYFGVFITPALLFFAFTGALQTFGLHETNRDHPNYKPAHWIQVLAQIHKKQVDTVPVRRPQFPAAASVPVAPASFPVTPASLPTAPLPAGTSSPAAEPSAPSSEKPHHHPAAAAPSAAAPHSQQPTPAQATPPFNAGATPERHKANPLPLRIFFLIVCIGLFTSTLTGLYMSYTYQRNKRVVTLALLAGIVLPPLLLLF